MGSFPDGCVKEIQQIWEMFYLTCQIGACILFISQLELLGVYPYRTGPHNFVWGASETGLNEINSSEQ